MEREHAILAASSAHRWTRCPASARLEELFRDEDTEYSKEGTLAHSFALKVLESDFNILEQTFPAVEMEEAVLEYTAYVIDFFKDAKEKCKFAFKAHEVKLDLSDYVPEGFGTADTVIIADGTMHVMDFKYGKGVKVDADSNEQMMLYALGAYNTYAMLYDIETVAMHIVQPRIDNISVSEISTVDLLSWGDGIHMRAKNAFSGKGDAIPGDHCQFCRARHICRARADQLQELQKVNKQFKLLSDEEVMQLYPLLDGTEKFIRDLKNYMLDEALAGKKWPGLKLVEGRSNRQYADELSVIEKLTDSGYKEAELTTRKLIGITDMTKLLGKKQFKELLEDCALIVKPEGKPTLVPESDKRPEVNLVETLLSEFETIEGGK